MMAYPYESDDTSNSIADLSHRIIRSSSGGYSRISFLTHISPIISRLAGISDFEIWVQDKGLYYRFSCVAGEKPHYNFNRLTFISEDLFCSDESCAQPSLLERLYFQVFSGTLLFPHGYDCAPGYFYTPDLELFFAGNGIPAESPEELDPTLSRKDPRTCMLMCTFHIDGDNRGLISYKKRKGARFSVREISKLRNTAELLGAALAGRRSHYALRERVKELGCLYEIVQIGANPTMTIEQILGKTATILPDALQFPELAHVRIEFDGSIYTSDHYEKSETMIREEIPVEGYASGVVEIGYRDFRSDLEEEAFLPEEHSFLRSVINQLSTLLERRLAQLEKEKLQDQLRHADRLATIGQLAAGVAHELNEPLAAILGFAQLIGEQQDVPEQSLADAGRIVTASLHAREVVKKLLIFARKLPQKKSMISLNEIIENDLYFLESRCTKEGITVERQLGDIPLVWADESQMHQVVINLVVNAIQAMPEGGSLTVRTAAEDEKILLVVDDTGIGMDESVLENLFLPFFTTKSGNEGTGIGLSVVHGIIEGLKGSIAIESEPEKGSSFCISIPVRSGG